MTKKKTQITFFKHFKFKIKDAFGLKLSNNEEIYKILDHGYRCSMTGNYLLKKLQEFDCLKKIVLSAKQMLLFDNLEKPKLQINKLLINFNHEKFDLFPLFQFDEKRNSMKIDEILKEYRNENKTDFKLKNNEILMKLMRFLNKS